MDSDPAAAAEAFRHAAELQPAESRPRFLAGFSLEHAGKFPEAIEQYRVRARAFAEGLRNSFRAGPRTAAPSDAPGAEAQFRAAIAARGDSAPARLGLANALLAEKKYDAASDALAEYLKLNPGDRPRILTVLPRSSISTGLTTRLPNWTCRRGRRARGGSPENARRNLHAAEKVEGSGRRPEAGDFSSRRKTRNSPTGSATWTSSCAIIPRPFASWGRYTREIRRTPTRFAIWPNAFYSE